MNLDPHIKQLADVLVGICVRELKKQKPGNEPGSCVENSTDLGGWNDDKNITNRPEAAAR